MKDAIVNVFNQKQERKEQNLTWEKLSNKDRVIENPIHMLLRIAQVA